MIPQGHLSLNDLWREATKFRKEVGHILNQKAGDAFWLSMSQSVDDVLWQSLCRFAENSLTASNMGKDPVQLDRHICLQTGFSLAFLLHNGIDPEFCKKYQMWNLRKHPQVTPDWLDECRDNPQSLCRGPLVNPNHLIDPTEAVWSEPGFAMPPVLVSILDGCIDTRFILDALKLEPTPLFPDIGFNKNLEELCQFSRWRVSIPKEKFDDDWPAFVEVLERQAKEAIHIDRASRPGRPNKVDTWVDLYFSTYPDGHAPLHWSEVCRRLETVVGRELDVKQGTLSQAVNVRKTNLTTQIN